MSKAYFPTSPTPSVVIPEEAFSHIQGQFIGATVGSDIVLPHLDLPITREAKAILPKIEDEDMLLMVERIITTIDEVLYAFNTAGGNVYSLPTLHAKILEDTSVTLEWASADFRLAFNIEQNLDDSSWYIVTSKRLSEVGANGFLSNLNSRGIVYLALNFILSNT